MSVVEKAAEKLRILHTETAAGQVEETTQELPSIERLRERTRTVDPPVVTTPPWHVDESALQRYGFFPADGEADWLLTDELRRIKRPVLDNVTGKGTKVPLHAERILVTSAVPGEGKTFTAVNLAMSLARERDFEVVLVDGDIPKSDVTRVLGLEGRPGLMDALADEHQHPAEVIIRTDVPNLLVVPAGTRHPLASELFGSRRMEYVLDGLQVHGSQRRLLVFDSSPLLATSDSRALLSHMGQVVMVVAAGRTSRQEVRSALEGMNDSQYVGLVLNRSHRRAGDNHYRHYGRYYAKGE